MRRFLKLPILLGLVSSAFLIAGGVSQAGAATTVSKNLILGGSDTTYYMMTSLADLYNQSPGCNALFSPQPLDGSCPNASTENKKDFTNYYHDFAVNRWPIGSSGGVNGLCKTGLAGTAHVDIARSSRVPLPASGGGSDCTGLHFVGYARDAVSWECFPKATGSGCLHLTKTTNSITTANLKNIFVNCTVTNWSQVGGTSVPIDVYVAQANSGTGISWAAALGVTLAPGQALTNCVKNPNNPGQPGSNVSLENTNSLIIANGDTKNAIFYFSTGVYHRTFGAGLTGSDGSSLGSVNGIAPTNANIANNSFPISRYVFNVYCKGDPSASNKCGTSPASPAAVTNFVGENGFLCKGESAFLNSGGKPILDPITGKAYRLAPVSGAPQGEIPATISTGGFVPVAKQSDGTYCVAFTT